MRSIEQIYEEYKIMPTLREHMLRVAAVASLICDSINGFENKNEVVIACLVHDMGNIIKFDLNYFPAFLEPEGLEYWQKIKDEYVRKYGLDEHAATEKLCREIGLPETVLGYLENIGFSKIQVALASATLGEKICCYSDQRVGPHGVLSIDERLIDGRKRYAGRKDKIIASERFEELASALRELEIAVFQKSNLTPEVITDEKIEKTMNELKKILIPKT